MRWSYCASSASMSCSPTSRCRACRDGSAQGSAQAVAGDRGHPSRPPTAPSDRGRGDDDDGAYDFITKPPSAPMCCGWSARRWSGRRWWRKTAPCARSWRRSGGRSSVGRWRCGGPWTSSGRRRHREATVLLLGESGTGKELLARPCKAVTTRRSAARAGQLRALPESMPRGFCCSAMRGAFTGATSRRDSRFAQAGRRHALFLDEVAEIPLHLQVKLLRVLQGADPSRSAGKLRRVDIRLVAATNKGSAPWSSRAASARISTTV